MKKNTRAKNLTLTLTRGIPASGKTSWAYTQLHRKPDTTAVVSRDDIRKTVFGRAVLSPREEQMVTEMEQDIVRRLFTHSRDKHVIVANTHLRVKVIIEWYEFLREFNGEVQLRVQEFNTPLEDCIRRDAGREEPVGEQRIREMHTRFVQKGGFAALPSYVYEPIRGYEHAEQDTTLPSAWMVDIDGTLARNTSRGYYDWGRVDEDEPIEHVIDLVKTLHAAGHTILVVSARDGECEAQTREWMDVWEVPYHHLYMRTPEDFRRDTVVKKELYEQHIKGKYNIRGVLDDRDAVVKMWRSQGLFVAQVAYGHF